jgi:hypothetical protein
MSHPDDRPRRPVSDKKLAANRANARKSTGPRTAEGKARSSMNSILHAWTVKQAVTADENPHRFVMFAKLIRADLRPQNFTQALLVERVIDLMWKMQRARDAQHDYVCDSMGETLHLIEVGMEHDIPKEPDDFDSLRGSRILLDSVRKPGGEAGAYLRLDTYAERLQRALVSVLRRLRQEQDRTGEGEPPADREFTVAALRRAARDAGKGDDLGGEDLPGDDAEDGADAESLSEATAGAAPESVGAAATPAPLDACEQSGARADDPPEKIIAGDEPTGGGEAADFPGIADPSLN